MGMQYSRGLIAGYPFENSGADITGAYPLTVNGATYGAGVFGQCAIFDGVDDFATNTNYIPTQSGTISMWANIGTWGTDDVHGRKIILSLKAGVIDIASTGTGQLRILCYYTGSLSRSHTITGLSLNTWYHIAVTYDASEIKFYLNGSPVNTQAFTGLVLTFGNGIWIGSSYNLLVDRFSNCKVDNVQIFNRVLTANEIKRLYLNLGI